MNVYVYHIHENCVFHYHVYNNYKQMNIIIGYNSTISFSYNSVHTVKLTVIDYIFACYYYLQILVLLVIYYGITKIDY